MDTITDIATPIGTFAWEAAKAAWSAAQAYPDAAAAVMTALAGFGIVWFIHGLIRKWKPCPKGGRNTSKILFKGTWSDASCCNGSGRHLRVPVRIVNSLRHR